MIRGSGGLDLNFPFKRTSKRARRKRFGGA